MNWVPQQHPGYAACSQPHTQLSVIPRLKVRIRSARDTFEEIRHKYHTYGVREIAFYEDNFLLEKPNIERLLLLLLEHKSEMPHLRLYAPEGVEVRLLHQDVEFVKLMRDTGFDSVYLPLETMSRDVTKAWNRRHSHAGLFEQVGMIRFCGHIPKGGYDVHDGATKQEPAPAPAV